MSANLDIAEIRRLWLSGKGVGAIAKIVGVSDARIRQCMVTLGLFRRKSPPARQERCANGHDTSAPSSRDSSGKCRVCAANKKREWRAAKAESGNPSRAQIAARIDQINRIILAACDRLDLMSRAEREEWRAKERDLVAEKTKLEAHAGTTSVAKPKP